MKLPILLPILLTCSKGLLVPNLSGSKSVSQLSKESNEYLNTQVEPITILNHRRNNQTVPVVEQEPQQYIVVYEEGHKNGEYEAHEEWITDQFSALRKRGEFDNLPQGFDDEVTFYNLSDFKGYAAYLPPSLLEEVVADPLVAFVEEDSFVESSSVKAQKHAPWGLVRVSQRENLSSRYFYDSEGGKGVTAYVLDSGIKVEHSDFTGRAFWGESFPEPGTELDENGHGSHVAGTIGGKTYGVAKNVDLVAVRVLNSEGKGRVSDIIKGLQFAVKDHQDKVAAKQRGYKGATINMSLGGGPSKSFDIATNAAVKAGVHVIVAAGNQNKNACNFSPARVGSAITVGSVDINDTKARTSNWGECVDINAPGAGILSVGIQEDSTVKSGTSMAAPHVSGLISYFLSLQPDLSSEFSSGKLITPNDMKRKIIAFGTKGALHGLTTDTPNVLIYNGAGKDLSEFWAL